MYELAQMIRESQAVRSQIKHVGEHVSVRIEIKKAARSSFLDVFIG